ncbi:MAG: DNA methyltransferase [candidate division WOR-3 bacterium]
MRWRRGNEGEVYNMKVKAKALFPVKTEENAVSLRSVLGESIDPVSWATGGILPGNGFKLFDDAGQIYELQLARMEFSTLGKDLDLFRKRSAYFEIVDGKPSYHSSIAKVRGKGQIGNSNQYMTHWFYPYKGKFHGQMIKAIINFMGAGEEDIILDPFLGSGTTLVETALLRTGGLGIDINPALCIVSQIKTDSLRINYDELNSAINQIGSPLRIFEYFKTAKLETKKFLPESEPVDAKEILDYVWEFRFPSSQIKELPFEIRNFLLLAYLHALSDYTYLKGTAKEKSFEKFFLINLSEYLQTIKGTYFTLKKLNLEPKAPEIKLASAMALPVTDNSITGIITSPPYSIALDYVKNDFHLLTYLGIDTSPLREQMVGLRGGKDKKLLFYEEDIRKSVEEMHRVLKPGAWAAIVLGDVVVDGKRTDFCQKIESWAPEIGFSDVYAMRRPILGGFAKLRYEYVLFLQKGYKE